MQIMHDFISDNRVIMNVSTRNKGLLIGGYTFIEMMSQSLSKNLGNSLLGSIVETDLSIMIHFTSFLALLE